MRTRGVRVNPKRAMSLICLATALAAPAVVARGDGVAGPVLLGGAGLEGFMDGLLSSRMEEKRAVGAAVVVVKDGRILFSKGYGHAERESGSPVDPARTLFRLGSISKLFVWTAVMQLAEEGRLSLDADVRAYLDFHLPPAYDEPITLARLLSHTAGFEDKVRGLFPLEAASVPDLRAYLTESPPARVFPPGKLCSYSNYGAALAAYIVERASGLPFAQYAEKRIFSPLGMESATFLQPPPPGGRTQIAASYNYVDGAYVRGGFEYVVPYPAGSASATALDMGAFMIAHLEGGRYGAVRILSEETAARMHGRSYSADPRMAGMAHGFFEKIEGNRRMLFHCGDTFLSHAALFLIPEARTGIFIATNAAGGAEVAESTALAFAARYFPAAATGEPVSVADFSVRAPRYTGEYYPSRSNFTTFEKAFTLLSPMRVSIAADEVVIAASGSVRRYRETEAGILASADGRGERIAMKEEGGLIYLHTADATVYLKAPWYGRAAFHLLIVVGGALVFLAATVRWGLSFIAGRERSSAVLLFRSIGAVFGAAFIVFLLCYLELMGDMHPVFRVPTLIFGTPPTAFLVFTILPAVLWFSGLVLGPAAVMAWVREQGTLSERLRSTVIAACALLILWSLAYWNVLP